MGGIVHTCPICLITYRVRSEEWQYNLFKHSPFFLKKNKIYCKGCNLPAIPTLKIYEHFKKIHDEIIKFDVLRLNDCIHKGYISEAIIMLHVQLIEQIKYLLLKKFDKKPNIPFEDEESYKKVASYIHKIREDYTIILLGEIYKRISEKERNYLIELNTMRNKFAHTFEERKKFDMEKIMITLNGCKQIENRLRKEIEKFKII